MKLRTMIMVAALMAPLSSQAQDAQEPASPWSGKASLGYLATSGNTDNSTLNTAFEVAYAVNKWTHEFSAAAVKASESSVTTAESYDAGWKSQRKIGEKDFLFGRLDWRKTRFGAFDTQFSQTVGYGRWLIDKDKHKLNAEIGGGARQSKDFNGITNSESIVRGGLYYKWLFSETAEFQQDLTTEVGQDNTFYESVTAVKSRLLGDLALVASYTIRRNSDVPPLVEKTDTYTAISIEYAF